MGFLSKLCRLFKKKKKQEQPVNTPDPVKEAPKTQASPDQSPSQDSSNQELWWCAASVHSDGRPQGTPPAMRKVWDDIVMVNPQAPEQYRPFWAMKSGGQTPLTDNFYEEVADRMKSGYRVLYCLKEGDPQDLANDLAEMNKRNALPWGVGLWNELDLGGKYSVKEFREKIVTAKLPEALATLSEQYGVHVTPPGFASFKNVIQEGYGAVVKELFSGIEKRFLKVHSYGHVQPKYWVEHDFKTKCQEAAGMEEKEIILEETANGFVGEHKPNKPGVSDEQGAEFMRAAMFAGMQTGIPTCHFMLYHGLHNFNDISHPEYGELRRIEANKVLDYVRKTGDINPEGALVLNNPKGK